MVDRARDDDADGARARPRSVLRRAGGRGRAAGLPESVSFLFASPPLAPGEEAGDWNALCDSLAEALQPRSVVDWLRLRDVACGVWESLRMERYRDALLRLERGRAAADVLASLLADRIDDAATRERAARSIARGWLAGRSAEKREMAQALSAAGIDEATLVAGAFMSQLDAHERIERLRRRAEEARDAALASLGQARPLPARAAPDLVIDAEIVEPSARVRRRAGRTEEGEADSRAVPAPRGHRRAPAAAPVDPAPAPDPQADLFG